MTNDLTRRTFIKSVAGAGGGLLLGVWLSACTNDDGAPTTGATSSSTSAPRIDPAGSTTTTAVTDPSAVFMPNLLLRIDGTGAVTVTVPKSEMGQGVRTSLAMVVAEELDADWSLVRVETADGDRAYGDQVTGGSLSVSTRFESMRRVGATARHMLIAAAAAQWGVDPRDCITEPGVVVAPDGARRTYGELAEEASRFEPPAASAVKVKDPADFRIIGEPTRAIDAEDIVTGRAAYGSDIRIPGMMYGVVARSPVFGSRVTAYDDAEARQVPGVIDVVEISTGVVRHSWCRGIRRKRTLSTTHRSCSRFGDSSIRSPLERARSRPSTRPRSLPTRRSKR